MAKPAAATAGFALSALGTISITPRQDAEATPSPVQRKRLHAAIGRATQHNALVGAEHWRSLDMIGRTAAGALTGDQSLSLSWGFECPSSRPAAMLFSRPASSTCSRGDDRRCNTPASTI